MPIFLNGLRLSRSADDAEDAAGLEVDRRLRRLPQDVQPVLDVQPRPQAWQRKAEPALVRGGASDGGFNPQVHV